MSKTLSKIALLAGVTAAGLFLQLQAQPSAEGWGPGGSYGRLYNPQSVVTLSGEVVAVTSFRPVKGATAGTRLVLSAGTERIAVHLGPAWYLERQDVKIAVGDRIEVRGSRITFQGQSAIIAAVVTKGTQRLELRNPETGIPLWSRGKA